LKLGGPFRFHRVSRIGPHVVLVSNMEVNGIYTFSKSWYSEKLKECFEVGLFQVELQLFQ
jgi:hypothetical protein